jgi:membrane protease YdiL (CAAX protease family)
MYWLYPILRLCVAFIALFIAVRNHFFDNLKSFFSLKKGSLFINIGFVIILCVAIFVSLYFLTAYAFHSFGFTSTNNTTYLNYFFTYLPQWYVPIDICVVTPIVEEIINRGCIYHLFSNKWVAFVVSAVLFAFLHTGFSVQILYYLPDAFLITLAYHRKQRLLDSMLVHALYNSPLSNLMFMLDRKSVV